MERFGQRFLPVVCCLEYLEFKKYVVDGYEQQVVLDERHVETFDSVPDKRLLVVHIFFLEAIAAEPEEQGHVEEVDEIEHPPWTPCMPYDHQDDAQSLGYRYGFIVFHFL